MKKSIKISPMIRSAIKDAVSQALRAKTLKLMSNGQGFEIYVLDDGNAYTAETALEKILGEYSWYKD